jgi:hypothetical protein
MSIVHKLTRFSMSWHSEVMKDVLLRYKILFLLVALLLAPTVESLIYVLTFPVTSLVSLNADMIAVTVSLLVFQGAGWLWLVLKETIFFTQPWANYMLSLPIQHKDKLRHDAIVLFATDFPLWLPLLLATSLNMYACRNEGYHMLLILGKCVLNMALLLTLQMAYKNRQLKVLGMVLLADILEVWVS